MKHVARLVAVLVLMTVVFVQPAGAIQNVTTHTKLRVSATTVQSGDLVKFKVRLKAGISQCRVHMPIKLFRNGKKVAKKRTNRKGKVVFKRHPRVTARWRAKFPGKKIGTHPNRYNCLPSKSKRRRVIVT